MHPLQGFRVLVTRTRHQASDLASHLEALGATVVLLPTIEIAPPLSYAPLDDAIANIEGFDWLVFTSPNAVEVFQSRAIRSLPSSVRVATIGPATMRAASAAGLPVSLTPATAIAEALSAALLPKITPGSKILLVRAAIARDHLPDALRDAGAEVTIADAYQTRIPAISLSAVRQIFSNPALHPHAITFASSSSVTNLFSLLQTADIAVPAAIIRASIGPVTTQTLRDQGFPPHVEAPDASIASLAASLADYLQSPPEAPL